MGLILAVSELYVPPFIRKRKLRTLFEATADAFQVAVPPTSGLSYNACLDLYARFTREQAEKTILQGNEPGVRYRLFRNACRIGRQYQVGFHINTPGDVMRMGTLVYRLLKIDFQGEPTGNIVIRRCFFSAYYSSRVCRLISSLDAGLLTGLSGGEYFTFSQRITEGSDCCRAFLELPGSLK